MIDSLYKSFIKGNALTLVGRLLVSVQAIVLVPVVIKTAGSTVYGAYVLISSILMFIYGISSFGVGFKYKRYLPAAKDDSERRNFFYPQAFFQLFSIAILGFLFFILSPQIKSAFLSNEVNFAVWIPVAYLLFYTIFCQVGDYFRYSLRLGYFNSAVASYPYVYVATVLLIYYVLGRLNLNTLLFSQTVACIIVGFPLAIKFFRETGFAIPQLRIENIVGDIKLGFPLILSYMVDFFFRVSDKYIIALFLSVTYVGYYAPAYTIGALMFFFPMVAGVVLQPLLSKAVDSGNEHEARIMVNYTINGYIILCIPFIVGCYFAGGQVLALFANAETAGNASFVIPIIAVAMLFYGMSLILSNVLFVRLKTSKLLSINAIAAVANFALNIGLIYFFKNIIVIAIATAFSSAMAFALMLVVTARHWAFTANWRIVAKAVTSSAVMGTVIFFIIRYYNSRDLTYNIYYVAVEIILSLLVYGLMLYALNVFSSKQLNYIRNTLMPWAVK